jgi:hypothetical protein
VRTIPSVDLVLRNDDLHAVSVVGTRNGMLEETYSSDDSALLDDADLATLRGRRSAKVARIANDLLSLDGLSATSHPYKLAIRICDDLIDGFVEHVRAAVDGAQASKGLRKLAEAVERIDVRRLAVASHRGSVEDDAFISRPCGFSNIAEDYESESTK